MTDEPTYTHQEVVRTIAALVDAAGGQIVVENRHMERANRGVLQVTKDPSSGAMRYWRQAPEMF